MSITFDAVGAGSSGALTTFSWSHTVTSGAYVIVDLVIDRLATVSSATFGGTAMTLLSSVGFNGVTSNGMMYRYGIVASSGGATTVSITVSTSSWGVGNSVSYKNVQSWGSTVTTYGSSATMLQNTYATGGQQVVQGMGSTGTTPEASGGTNRYGGTASNNVQLTMSDASAPTTFTCVSSSVNWSGVATTLVPSSFRIYYKGFGSYTAATGGDYITDDFNRSSLGSNWTNRLTPSTTLNMQIVNSNAMGISGVNNYAFAQYTAQDMAGDNVRITITIGPDTVSSDYYIIGLRGDGTNVVYAYCAPASAPSIYTHSAAGGDWRNMINGSQVSRASGPAAVTWLVGDKLSFEARGNIYTIKRNDVVVCRWNDSGGVIYGSNVNGSHRQWGLGLGTNGTFTRGMIDDVKAQTVGVPPVPPYSDAFSTSYTSLSFDDNWTSWTGSGSGVATTTTSGRATPSTTGNWAIATYNWPMLTNNHKASAVYTNPNVNYAACLYVRSNNSNQVFAYVIDTGNATIMYTNTNTYVGIGGTQYGNTVIDWADGDTASLEAVGNCYVIRKNGIAQIIIYDTNGATWGANVNSAHRDVGIALLNNSGTVTGWNSFAADDLPSNYFLPSQMTKSGTLAWATSATWTDITVWNIVNDTIYTSTINGSALIVLTSQTNTLLSASVPFTGSTAGRQHTIRIMRTRTTTGTADTTVIATGSIVTGVSGTCTVSAIANVLEGETYTIQMNSDGASAGTITDATPSFTIGSIIENTNTVSMTVPAGATGCYVTMIGGGGGGGTGWGQSFASAPGGGGGGGAAVVQRSFIAAASLGATYSVTVGTGGSSATNGGDSTFTSGSVTITAGGGVKGSNATSTTVAGSGGSGGTTTVSGVSGITTVNGTAGASGSASGAGSSASNNTSGGAPGGGGGGFRTSGGGTNNGGSGGNSVNASGATGAAGSGAAGGNASASQPGGGGAGSGSGNGSGYIGGNGGKYGAGGGGSGGDNTAYAGGTGGNGYTLIEWV